MVSGQGSEAFYLWGGLQERDTDDSGESAVFGMQFGPDVAADFEKTDWHVLEQIRL